MPRVRRSRTIPARPEAVWDVISDPHHLPRWWPGLLRVEEASPAAWTKVMSTPKGKPVRADFTRVRAQRPRELVWRQEIAESPFERILQQAVTEISLRPVDGKGTVVELRADQRLRGLARFGTLMVRRATARQLDEALRGLAQVAGGRT